MQTQEPEEWIDDDDVSVCRDRARGMLGQIAAQAKQALADADIDLDLFFLVPSTGSSVLIFGTITDPPDSEWKLVADIVAEIVRATVGLDRVRSRPVQCATTDTVESSPVEMPIPVSAPLTALHTGAEAR